jgi:hypothetical protein
MNFKLIFLILTYLVFTIALQVAILLNDELSNSQKRVHSILLWLIPFIWGGLLISTMSILKRPSKPIKSCIHDSEYHDNMIETAKLADTSHLD